MAKLLRLAAAGTDATAVAAQTGVAYNTSPFLGAPGGWNVVYCIDGKGVTGAPVFKIQESDDLAFTTPVDLVATSGIVNTLYWGEIAVTRKYVRFAVTTGAGAGTIQCVLLAGGAP